MFNSKQTLRRGVDAAANFIKRDKSWRLFVRFSVVLSKLVQPVYEPEDKCLLCF